MKNINPASPIFVFNLRCVVSIFFLSSLFLIFSGCDNTQSNGETDFELRAMPDSLYSNTDSLLIIIHYNDTSRTLYSGKKSDADFEGPYTLHVTDYGSGNVSYQIIQFDSSGAVIADHTFLYDLAINKLLSVPKLALSVDTLIILAGANPPAQNLDVFPTNAGQLTWRAQDTNNFFVHQTGEIIAIAPGTSWVYVALTDTPSVNDSLFVIAEASSPSIASSLSLQSDTLTLYLGNSDVGLMAQLSPPSPGTLINWFTTDSSIATVTSSGVVSAKKTGSVFIKAKAPLLAVSDSLLLIVEHSDSGQTIQSLQFKQPELELQLGQGSHPLQFDIAPAQAKAITKWLAKDPSIVKVSEAGIVTPLSLGSTSVSISEQLSGISDTLLVRVTTPVPNALGQLKGEVIAVESLDPISGVPVSIGNTQTITDADGAYLVGKLQPGLYTLYIGGSAYRLLTRQVAVAADETTSVEPVALAQLTNEIKVSVNGQLVGKTEPISRVDIQVTGDSISKGAPRLYPLGFDKVSGKISGKIFIPSQGAAFQASIHIYDESGHKTGYAERGFTYLFESVDFDTVNAQNAVPVIYTLDAPDTMRITTTRSLDPSVNDPIGTITNYEWNLGDGNGFQSLGRLVTITALSDSPFSISLRITDNHGNQATSPEHTIFVDNAPPSIVGLSDKTISLGDSVLFDLKAPDEAGIKSFIIDFGDGSEDTLLNSGTYKKAHIYPSVIAGESQAYTVIASIQNNADQYKIEKATVTVFKDAPQFTAFPSKTVVNHSGTVVCSATVYQKFGSIQFQIDTAGDNNYIPMQASGPNSAAFQFTTGANSSWGTVNIRATDDDGNSIDSSFSVDIVPRRLSITSIERTSTHINLKWNASTESDFASYTIYRSESSNMSKPVTWVPPITNKNTNQFSKNVGKETTHYYYVIHQTDTEGLKSVASPVKTTLPGIIIIDPRIPIKLITP